MSFCVLTACFSHIGVSGTQLAKLQSLLTLWCMGQVWWLRETAHGVRLASIRPGWVWLPRSTAHGASLGSTKLDQVLLICCGDDLYHGFLVCQQNAVLDHRALHSIVKLTWRRLHWTGLITENNCTWCTAGKYQTGSGPNPSLLLVRFYTSFCTDLFPTSFVLFSPAFRHNNR